MQVKTAIKYIAMALTAVTVLHAPLVQGGEMTSYGSKTPATISPARIKVMQNEQKILGHSPYAKAAGVDLSQVGSNAVPVVTPASASAPAPVSVPAAAPTSIATDAALNPERVEIIQMELKELGFSPHAEATGVDLKKAGFVIPDRAAVPSSTSTSMTPTTGASDASTTITANSDSDVVQTGAGY